MEVREILDFTKIVELLETIQKDNLRVHGMKPDINRVAQCLFIHEKTPCKKGDFCEREKDFSFSIWFTKSNISIQEFGYNLIPMKVYPLEQIRALDLTPEGFRITFKNGYRHKERPCPYLDINLEDIQKSTIF